MQGDAERFPSGAELMQGDAERFPAGAELMQGDAERFLIGVEGTPDDTAGSSAIAQRVPRAVGRLKVYYSAWSQS